MYASRFPDLRKILFRNPTSPSVQKVLISRIMPIINGPNFVCIKIHTRKKRNKNGTIPIPIIETGSTKHSLKTKIKRKNIIGTFSLFKPVSESEKYAVPVNSRYIQDVLTWALFCVYQEDTRGLFKIGPSSFKFHSKHLFIDGKSHKTTQVLWELLTLSDVIKLISTDSHTNEFPCSLSRTDWILVHWARSKHAKMSNIYGLFRNCLQTQNNCLGNCWINVNVSR